MTATSERVDVVIVGAGPAGAAAAIHLRQLGHSVTLFADKRPAARPTVETMTPSLMPLLVKLGAWELFLSAQFLPTRGIRSAWGSDTPTDIDFLFSPYGKGWHVNRAQFDEQLLHTAALAGCHIRQRERVRSFTRTDSSHWCIQGARNAVPVTSKFLVDATGRSSWAARKLGAKRVRLDSQVALAGMFNLGRDEGAVSDNRLYVESISTGWWYSSPVNQRTMMAVFLSDADLLPRDQPSLKKAWEHALQASTLTQERLGRFKTPLNIQATPADTSRLDRAQEEGWLAIGDAAFTIDPLSGLGVFQALEAAPVVAREISNRINGNQFNESYNDWIEGQAGRLARDRSETYQRETRWPRSEYWKRRHQIGMHDSLPDS